MSGHNMYMYMHYLVSKCMILTHPICSIHLQ